MAALTHLTKLFQAMASKNWTKAEALGREIADAEEATGHHAAAQRLRGALVPLSRTTKEGRDREADEISEPQSPTYFLSSALLHVTPDRDLADLRLRAASRISLNEVSKEWNFREELAKHGVIRRRKLLFHGPPGCGKSVTARALGRELSLPVYVVRFDAVVGAYLGQTALHLRQIFRFAESSPCIVLLDEIDALGKRRGNPLDVGELDRVVIALLQELEHSLPEGLLVATSNLARELDDALWRRFDLVIEFPAPTAAELKSFATQYARTKQVVLARSVANHISKTHSFAEAERMVDGEVRKRVLSAL